MQIDLTDAGRRNALFLSRITQSVRRDILGTIAAHYEVTQQEALEEVTGDEAEHLLDYLTEPHRSAVRVIMARHGF